MTCQICGDKTAKDKDYCSEECALVAHVAQEAMANGDPVPALLVKILKKLSAPAKAEKKEAPKEKATKDKAAKKK